MATLSFITDPPKWLVAVSSSLGTALLAGIAAVWLSYNDFRGKRVEQNAAATEQTVQSTSELRPILDRFVSALNGKSSITADDRTRLSAVVRQSYDRAEDVRNRLGGLDKQFNELGTSLVDLKDAGEKFVDPYSGGKQLFQAYSRWIVADQNWREAVQRRQNSYFSTFRF